MAVSDYFKTTEDTPFNINVIANWRANIEKTERLLPLAVGNLTVSSTNQVNMVLRFGSDNHNIYDNIAGQ